MYEFYSYSKKNRHKKSLCTQIDVTTKTDLLKLRINPKLKYRIMELSKEKNKSASGLTRLLWLDYFRKVDDRVWQEETKDW